MRTPAIQFLTVAILACLSLPVWGQENKPEPVPQPPIQSSDSDDLFDAGATLPSNQVIRPAEVGRVRGILPDDTPVPARNRPRVQSEPRDYVFQPTPAPRSIDQVQQNRLLQREMAKLLEKQAQHRHDLAAAHQNLVFQQTKNLPPLENGKLHAYRLQHIDPKLLAETLESFLGTNQLRLVPDIENNILLTYSTLAVSEQIADLVKVLDAEKESIDFNLSLDQTKEKTQALQVRIFWLGDDFGDTHAEEYLPEAVVKAVQQLGIEEPLLISQSATTVAGNQGDSSEFEFSFPALIGGQLVNFESGGEINLGPQPQLYIHLRIQGEQPIDLAGKLSAPLGHYMVLGTTNYVADKATTSRFAFVVQVVEAESFAPED